MSDDERTLDERIAAAARSWPYRGFYDEQQRFVRGEWTDDMTAEVVKALLNEGVELVIVEPKP